MDQVYIDEETGECIVQSDQTSSFSGHMNDAETGEPEISIKYNTNRCKKIPFQIPKDVKNKQSKKWNKMELEPVPVGTCFGQINPICLFISAIGYFRLALVFLMIFEVVLHIWAHHKNKTLKNANVYFRSPFHAISAEFCALCQNETCMDRVGKIQQIRLHKFLKQCNYMKRVVT